MDKFLIEGGHSIQGEVYVQGNKNEALPILCACLLTKGRNHILNLPNIKDIQQLIKILVFLGVEIQTKEKEIFTDANTLKNLKKAHIPPELIKPLRGSITLMAPLLARYKKITFPKPGGDKIGRRRIDTHLLALKKLGAKVQVFQDHYILELKSSFKGANILLDEASVTATENAIMAASIATGITTIENAASEPHVQKLCEFFINQGVSIQGVGSNFLTIEGVESYKNLKPIQHKISPDYLEIGSFISITALTQGELIIKDVIPIDLRMILFTFNRLGITTKFINHKNTIDLLIPQKQKLKIKSDVHGDIPKLDDAPWPGLPADMMSIMLITATQCEGTVLIHEKLFESRLFFTDKLIGMGAKIVLCDPHRAVVIGKSTLHGTSLSSPDIRAGMALVIASLVATGESIIHNIEQIDRGYEYIDLRLKKLGAYIQRA